MNRLIIPNGGMPLHGDDFRWIQDGVKDGIKGLVHLFASPYNGNIVLSGCAASYIAGNLSLTPGYVSIDYEVCYFPGATITVPSGGASLKLSITYDTGGLDVFADLVSRNTYEIRTCQLTDGIADGSEVVVYNSGLASIPRLQTIIEAYTVNSLVSQDITGFANSWTIFTGSQAKLYRHLNKVQLQGLITGGTSNGSTAFVLPVGFRPPVDLAFLVYGDPNYAYLNILTTGNVVISQSPTNTFLQDSEFISLAGVSFYL